MSPRSERAPWRPTGEVFGLGLCISEAYERPGVLKRFRGLGVFVREGGVSGCAPGGKHPPGRACAASDRANLSVRRALSPQNRRPGPGPASRPRGGPAGPGPC